MKGAAAVFRRELGALLDSAVAWVATVLFVLGSHSAFFFLGFPVGDRRLPAFWTGKLASLDAFFAWIPLALCVLAPALTMGAWADERRSGTDELLLTQPVRAGALVVAKLAAAWLFLGAVVALAVLPLAAMVSAVGPLDWGTVWGGLLGAWMLAGVCVAIGLLASSATADPLVAFLSSTAFLLVLWSAGLYVRVLPGPLAEVAWYASPTLHFLESGAHGVFDGRDVVYHGLFVAGALSLNLIALAGRRWG